MDPLDADLLLHYDFSDGIGDSTIDDVSGNGNDGTVQGTGATVDTEAGVLELPGGANGSGAGYVQLPTGMFDGEDTLSISTWLRNDTGSGNYSAMFFGTTQNLPVQYWILNPANTAGRFKTVVTNGSNASAPWGTEYGISPSTASQGIAGPLTDSDWAMYTTVITPTSITGYLDGEKVGSVAITRTVTDFGTDLVSYIGRSSYPDMFYEGGVRDVRVYTAAMSDSEVAGLYYSTVGDTDLVAGALASDADGLGVPSHAAADLDLAAMGANGSSIAWASSNESVIGTDGTVVRPSTDNEDVTLTATLSLAGETLVREFVVTVVADTPQGDVDYAASLYDLGVSVVWDDVTLTDMFEGATVTWASSDEAIIATDGEVTRPAVETEVTLTAEFEKSGATVELPIDVTVLAAVEGYLGTYVKTGTTDAERAVYYALSEDGTTFDALNDNQAVLYPAASDRWSDVNREVTAPTVFHLADGGYGLLALLSNGSTNDAYVYQTSDLARFEGQQRVTFAPAGYSMDRVAVDYDNARAAYVLTFEDTVDGKFYEVLSADLMSFSDPVEVMEAPAAHAGTYPDGATAADAIGVTADEYAHLATVLLLDRVHSTSVDDFDVVEVAPGEDPELPSSAMVNYSSGESVEMGVEWDLDGVDLSTPGDHTVTGTVQAPLNTSALEPIAWKRADPDVTIGDDGMYYLTGSYPMFYGSDPTGYDRVVLRRAETLEGLDAAESEEVTIWLADDHVGYYDYVWAPELAKIGDSWYVLFTTSRYSGSVWDKQPAMLKFTGESLSGPDALDPAMWETVGYTLPEVSDSTAFSGNFALDMTHFEHDGTDYMIWADKWELSTLRMASVDTDNPLQLTSKSIELTHPEYAWEINSEGGIPVNEGPAVFKNDGKIFIAFSSSSVDTAYNISFLWADENADLLDPASWTKAKYPFLGTGDVPGMFGMGHNSFTTDEFGQTVLVYHARSYDDTDVPAGTATDGGLFDPRRNAHAKLVHFNSDGMPILDMTAEEELDPALASVSVTVHVTAAPVTFSDVTPTNTAFFSEISWLAAQGISKGWANGDGSFEFRPFNEITRDAMAAFLYRLAGSPEVTLPAVSPFSDVTPSSTQFYTEIVWLYQEGISKGWANKDGSYEFRPFEPISRDAIAAFLYRFAGEPEWTDPVVSPFTDVTSTNTQFYTEITWLADTGITTGWADGTFRPFNEVTRDAMAAFLYRYAHM